MPVQRRGFPLPHGAAPASADPPEPGPADADADPPKPDTVPAPAPVPARGLARALLRVLAVVSLLLAALGVVLPGLPTTPFVLVAAWAAARSSPRMLAWLEAHRLFGPMVRDWRTGGRVSRRAKWCATFTMLACAVLMAWLSPVRWAALVGIGTMAVVGAWLWCRPEPATPSFRDD